MTYPGCVPVASLMTGGYAPAPPATLLRNEQQLTEDGCKRGNVVRELWDIQSAFKKTNKLPYFLTCIRGNAQQPDPSHLRRIAFPSWGPSHKCAHPRFTFHYAACRWGLNGCDMGGRGCWAGVLPGACPCSLQCPQSQGRTVKTIKTMLTKRS